MIHDVHFLISQLRSVPPGTTAWAERASIIIDELASAVTPEGPSAGPDDVMNAALEMHSALRDARTAATTDAAITQLRQAARRLLVEVFVVPGDQITHPDYIEPAAVSRPAVRVHEGQAFMHGQVWNLETHRIGMWDVPVEGLYRLAGPVGASRITHDDAVLVIEHRFKVPAENMGGQNHDPEQWLEDLCNVAGFGPAGRFEVLQRPRSDFPFWWVKATGAERWLRFLCVVFDLHAEQSPDDPTDPTEANRLDESIDRAKKLAAAMAMDPGPKRAQAILEATNHMLTLELLTEACENDPQRIITFYDGRGYKHLEIVESPPEGEPSVILAAGPEVDTRDF